MRLPTFFAFLSSLAASAFTACDMIDEPKGEEMLVIDALISADGFPKVVLTRTANFHDDSNVHLSDIVPRWATVEISDGAQTFTLTGRYVADAFPPFVYDTYRFRGKAGATYTITARDKDLKLTARATIPSICPTIRNVELRRVAGSDSLVSGTLHFSLPLTADTLCVMAWVCDRRYDGSSFYPGFISMKKTTGGDNLVLPLNRGKHRDMMEHFSPNFSLDDVVDVIFGVVDRNVYDYWERFQNNVYFSGGAFISPTSEGIIRANVDDGALGVFNAVGADRIHFIVRETDIAD